MSDIHSLSVKLEAVKWQKNDLRCGIKYGIGMLNGVRVTALPDVQKEIDAVIHHFNKVLEHDDDFNTGKIYNGDTPKQKGNEQ